MKRIYTFTEEARQAFMETIIRAYTEGVSSFRCNVLWCEECPLRRCELGCCDELTVEEWLAWAMEDVE